MNQETFETLKALIEDSETVINASGSSILSKGPEDINAYVKGKLMDGANIIDLWVELNPLFEFDTQTAEFWAAAEEVLVSDHHDEEQ